jgi:hypothetical protein
VTRDEVTINMRLWWNGRHASLRCSWRVTVVPVQVRSRARELLWYRRRSPVDNRVCAMGMITKQRGSHCVASMVPEEISGRLNLPV